MAVADFSQLAFVLDPISLFGVTGYDYQYRGGALLGALMAFERLPGLAAAETQTIAEGLSAQVSVSFSLQRRSVSV